MRTGCLSRTTRSTRSSPMPVLMHLSEPARALVEMRRVLRPGGIVGVRSTDFGTCLFTPATPLLDQWIALVIRSIQHNGGNPFVGRHLRQEFIDIVCAHYGCREEAVQFAGETLRHLVRTAPHGQQYVAELRHAGDEQLEQTVLESLCVQLGIPPEEFGQV